MNKNKKQIWKVNFKLWEILILSFEIIILVTFNVFILFSRQNDPILIFVNVLSIFSTITGVISNILASKKSILNYIFGITHVISYGIVAFFLTIYGDFILNIFYFLPTNIYGLIYWKKYITENNEDIKSKKLNNKKLLLIVVGLIILIPLFGLLLGYLGDKSPFLDAASTLLSILGMILMAKFYKEQWYVWLLVNIVSTFIYVSIVIREPNNYESILYIIMWSFYILNSIIGIIRWRK